MLLLLVVVDVVGGGGGANFLRGADRAKVLRAKVVRSEAPAPAAPRRRQLAVPRRLKIPKVPKSVECRVLDVFRKRGEGERLRTACAPRV